jgi:hypothetical protein
MRKLFVMAVLVLIAAAAFAQDAPKNNEIYGTVWFDYDASGARLGNAAGFPMTASDFSFSRMRFGLRNTLADNVKTWFEFDPRNLEFRQVNLDWSPLTGLDLIVGKQSKLFAQNDDWLFGDRTLGLQARYSMPGLGWAGIQVGNDADIANLSSKKFGWEGTTATNIPVTEANPAVVKIYPQITVKPDLGTDVGLEAGVNMEIAADKLGLASPTGTSLNGYVVLSGFGATLTAEYTWTNINDSATANQDMVLYTKLAYNAGMVVPTAYFVVDNLAGTNTAKIGSFTNNVTPNSTVMFELPINATKDLVIDPFFSYAVSGDNLMEYFVQGWSAGQIASWPNNDWTAGLRIKYNISSKW